LIDNKQSPISEADTNETIPLSTHARRLLVANDPNDAIWKANLAANSQEMARALRGHLDEPQLTWKYYRIQALFGWNLAKYAQVVPLAAKWAAVRPWDRAMFRIGHRTLTGREAA